MTTAMTSDGDGQHRPGELVGGRLVALRGGR